MKQWGGPVGVGGEKESLSHELQRARDLLGTESRERAQVEAAKVEVEEVLAEVRRGVIPALEEKLKSAAAETEKLSEELQEHQVARMNWDLRCQADGGGAVWGG